jgi:CspA family cold shock protein
VTRATPSGAETARASLGADVTGEQGWTDVSEVDRRENARPATARVGEHSGTLNRLVGLCWVAMASGKVDFFNDTGGYGFIETEDSDEDVFFHMEDVGGEDLTEGTEIEFDIEQAPKGPRATNVVRA